MIGDVMDVLGGRIFESSFCDSHAGQAAICTRSVDCSVRSLWRAVQVAVDQVLNKATLRDLLQNEEEMNTWVREHSQRQGSALDSVGRATRVRAAALSAFGGGWRGLPDLYPAAVLPSAR